MGDLSHRKKDWDLDQTAFDKLLAWLDSDRECAAGKYVNLRCKLEVFFECRGCLEDEEYADKTLDRVARIITERGEAPKSDPALYCYRVAQHLLEEYWRKCKRMTIVPGDQPTSQDPFEAEQENERLYQEEKRLVCLEQCLQEFGQENRTLILQFYEGNKGVRIRNRHRLARRLGITLNALRIRALRLRKQLVARMQVFFAPTAAQ